MVSDLLVAARGIDDPRVLARDARSAASPFLFRDAMKGKAYGDHSLPIGCGQTISQPYVVGAHDPAPGRAAHRVLGDRLRLGLPAAVLGRLARWVFYARARERAGAPRLSPL